MNLKMNRRVWAITFACLAMFVLGMADNIRGPLFPELLIFFNLILFDLIFLALKIYLIFLDFILFYLFYFLFQN